MREILDNPTYMNYLFCGLLLIGIIIVFLIVSKLLNPKTQYKNVSKKSNNGVYNRLILEKIKEVVDEYPNMKFGEILLNLGVIQTGTNKKGTKYTINPGGIPSKTMYHYLRYVKVESDLSENDD